MPAGSTTGLERPALRVTADRRDACRDQRRSAASASSISARGMPSRYSTASRYGTLTAVSACAADHRLGVERDAQPGRGEHVEVVRAVADGDGARQRQPFGLRRTGAARGLAGPVDDLADDPAGQPPSATSRRFACTWSMPSSLGERLDDLDEPAGDHAPPVKPSRCRVRHSVRAPGVSRTAAAHLVEHAAGSPASRPPARAGWRRSRARRASRARSRRPPRPRGRRAPRAARSPRPGSGWSRRP